MKQNSLPAYLAGETKGANENGGFTLEREDARFLPPRASYFIAWLFLRGGTGLVLGHICGQTLTQFPQSSKMTNRKVMAAILARSAMDRKRSQELRERASAVAIPFL